MMTKLKRKKHKNLRWLSSDSTEESENTGVHAYMCTGTHTHTRKIRATQRCTSHYVKRNMKGMQKNTVPKCHDWTKKKIYILINTIKNSHSRTSEEKIGLSGKNSSLTSLCYPRIYLKNKGLFSFTHKRTKRRFDSWN